MSGEKISVIIPCYNVKDMVSECLDSIVAQTIGLEHLEIILIDDASADETVSVLKKYEEKYPDNIMLVLCEKNGRQGTARNIGLSYATGDFISFVDSDDWIHPVMFKELFDIMNKNDCDVVQLNEPVDDKGILVISKTQLVDNLTVVFMENQAFDECVKQNGANGKFDALAYDAMSNQTRDCKMYKYPLFNKIPNEVEVCFPKKLPKHSEDVYARRVGKNGELECRMEKYLNEEPEPNSERFVPFKEFYNTRKITIGKTLDKAPFGMENEVGSGLVLFMPERAMAKICPAGIEKLMVMLYNSDNPTETSEKMCQVLENNDRSTGDLYNYAREIQDVRAMMLVIKIFSYGFIILISLISIANVFNTISTNILLRRREFAVLRSVGMTRHGFYKMMNLECILYGCKGLFFGLIASVGVTYLIYLSLRNQMILDFYIPWYSVVIAVFSVFFVVFCTMLYAMRKIQKDNVAETLKSDVF